MPLCTLTVQLQLLLQLSTVHFKKNNFLLSCDCVCACVCVLDVFFSAPPSVVRCGLCTEAASVLLETSKSLRAAPRSGLRGIIVMT